jgi:hypothetical protein
MRQISSMDISLRAGRNCVTARFRIKLYSLATVIKERASQFRLGALNPESGDLREVGNSSVLIISNTVARFFAYASACTFPCLRSKKVQMLKIFFMTACLC